MEQPEDRKTIDMLEAPRRGRGRPPVENPLSPAERAKRYRERRRAEGKTRPDAMALIRDKESVTKNDNRTWRLELEIQQLRRELDSNQRFAEVRAEMEQAYQVRLTDAEQRIGQLTQDALRMRAQRTEALVHVGTLLDILGVFLDARRTKKGLPADVLSRAQATYDHIRLHQT